MSSSLVSANSCAAALEERLAAALAARDAEGAAMVLWEASRISPKQKLCVSVNHCRLLGGNDADGSDFGTKSVCDGRLERCLMEAARRGDVDEALRIVARRLLVRVAAARPFADCAAAVVVDAERSSNIHVGKGEAEVHQRLRRPLRPHLLWASVGVLVPGDVGRSAIHHAAFGGHIAAVAALSGAAFEVLSVLSSANGVRLRRALRDEEINSCAANVMGAEDASHLNTSDEGAGVPLRVALRCCTACPLVHFIPLSGAPPNNENKECEAGGGDSALTQQEIGEKGEDATAAMRKVDGQLLAGAPCCVAWDSAVGPDADDANDTPDRFPHHACSSLAQLATKPPKKRAEEVSNRMLVAVSDGDLVNTRALIAVMGADVEFCPKRSGGRVPPRAAHYAAMLRDGTTAVAMLRLLADGDEVGIIRGDAAAPSSCRCQGEGAAVSAKAERSQQSGASAFMPDVWPRGWAGADLTATATNGETPLHSAAGRGTAAAVKFLLSRLATPFPPQESAPTHRSALDAAVENANVGAVAALLRHGVGHNSSGGATADCPSPLRLALSESAAAASLTQVFEGSASEVSRSSSLLKEEAEKDLVVAVGADLDVVADGGFGPFAAVAQLLLAAGADM